MEATLTLSANGSVRFITILLNEIVYQISETNQLNEPNKFEVISDNDEKLIVELDGCRLKSISVND